MGIPLSVRAVLLEMLLRNDGSGTDLIKAADGLTGGRVRLNYGSVYPMLHSMEDEGLLHAFEGAPSKRGGRRHRRYRLTQAGEAEARLQRDIVEAIFAGHRPVRSPRGRPAEC